MKVMMEKVDKLTISQPVTQQIAVQDEKKIRESNPFKQAVRAQQCIVPAFGFKPTITKLQAKLLDKFCLNDFLYRSCKKAGCRWDHDILKSFKDCKCCKFFLLTDCKWGDNCKFKPVHSCKCIPLFNERIWKFKQEQDNQQQLNTQVKEELKHDPKDDIEMDAPQMTQMDILLNASVAININTSPTVWGQVAGVGKIHDPSLQALAQAAQGLSSVHDER
jgi:hypothetical protein